MGGRETDVYIHMGRGPQNILDAEASLLAGWQLLLGCFTKLTRRGEAVVIFLLMQYIVGSLVTF